MKQELKDEMLRRAAEGKLSCAEARGIAERLGISYSDVGSAANELGIKIRDCELGCF